MKKMKNLELICSISMLAVLAFAPSCSKKVNQVVSEKEELPVDRRLDNTNAIFAYEDEKGAEEGDDPESSIPETIEDSKNPKLTPPKESPDDDSGDNSVDNTDENSDKNAPVTPVPPVQGPGTEKPEKAAPSEDDSKTTESSSNSGNDKDDDQGEDSSVADNSSSVQSPSPPKLNSGECSYEDIAIPPLFVSTVFDLPGKEQFLENLRHPVNHRPMKLLPTKSIFRLSLDTQNRHRSQVDYNRMVDYGSGSRLLVEVLSVDQDLVNQIGQENPYDTRLGRDFAHMLGEKMAVEPASPGDIGYLNRVSSQIENFSNYIFIFSDKAPKLTTVQINKKDINIDLRRKIIRPVWENNEDDGLVFKGCQNCEDGDCEQFQYKFNVFDSTGKLLYSNVYFPNGLLRGDKRLSLTKHLRALPIQPDILVPYLNTLARLRRDKNFKAVAVDSLKLVPTFLRIKKSSGWYATIQENMTLMTYPLLPINAESERIKIATQNAAWANKENNPEKKWVFGSNRPQQGPFNSYHYNPNNALKAEPNDHWGEPMTVCGLVSVAQQWQKNYCNSKTMAGKGGRFFRDTDKCAIQFGHVYYQTAYTKAHATHGMANQIDYRLMGNPANDIALMGFSRLNKTVRGMKQYSRDMTRKFIETLLSQGGEYVVIHDPEITKPLVESANFKKYSQGTKVTTTDKKWSAKRGRWTFYHHDHLHARIPLLSNYTHTVNKRLVKACDAPLGLIESVDSQTFPYKDLKVRYSKPTKHTMSSKYKKLVGQEI